MTATKHLAVPNRIEKRDLTRSHFPPPHSRSPTPRPGHRRRPRSSDRRRPRTQPPAPPLDPAIGVAPGPGHHRRPRTQPPPPPLDPATATALRPATSAAPKPIHLHGQLLPPLCTPPTRTQLSSSNALLPTCAAGNQPPPPLRTTSSRARPEFRVRQLQKFRGDNARSSKKIQTCQVMKEEAAVLPGPGLQCPGHSLTPSWVVQHDSAKPFDAHLGRCPLQLPPPPTSHWMFMLLLLCTFSSTSGGFLVHLKCAFSASSCRGLLVESTANGSLLLAAVGTPGYTLFIAFVIE
ncbi:proline-rich receptor-like protein kinase PERK10 [Triticum aestivum]|uniref:proline-rich receptor-like protein kinase PERK10 n=1 Tax=Triticum aestivum TaxID=4565 RepID=UPI001D033B52|nr:proline-rich receptor-like protein kinase PERK10 [Triticum aestivum]